MIWHSSFPSLERLSATYPGEEAKGRMALLLQRTGAEQRARAMFAEIRKSVERGPAFYRRAQREWYEIARRPCMNCTLNEATP
jgi:hypothetical protein